MVDVHILKFLDYLSESGGVGRILLIFRIFNYLQKRIIPGQLIHGNKKKFNN